MNQETESSTVEDKDARTWAMICHLSALTGYVLPFGNIIGPLIVWLIKKDEYAFVDAQGKEAINFQITVTIACIISIVLIFILIGFVLLGIVAVYALVMMIVAAVKANEGVNYQYPYVIRLLK